VLCVLLCFINPILGNRYGPGVIPFQGTWGGQILTLHFNYAGPLLFLFEQTHNYYVDNQGLVPWRLRRLGRAKIRSFVLLLLTIHEYVLVPAWHIDHVRLDTSQHLCVHQDVLWQGLERQFRVCIQRSCGSTQSAYGQFETHLSSCIHSSLYLLHQCVCLFVDIANTPLTLQAY